MKCLTLLLVSGPVLLAPWIAIATPPHDQSGTAYRNARQHAHRIADTAADPAKPVQVDEVRIGYFGPGQPDHPTAGDLWCAALLATAEANAQGGYQGKPFRLVSAWSESPWKGGVTELARLIYNERIWAIVGGIDGPSTHLAEQLAAKAHLAVVSPVATDKSVNLAGVPWMFSCAPGDHLLAHTLAGAIAQSKRHGPFVLLEANDHDSHLFAVELSKALAKRSVAPLHHFQFSAHQTDLPPLVTRTVATQPGAIAVVADAATSAAIIQVLRQEPQHAASSEHGRPVPVVFGTPAMAQKAFRRLAGEAAEGTQFPLVSLAETDQAPPQWASFAEAFEKRFGRAPDYRAGQTYDAVRLVINSIHAAGLNRRQIAHTIQRGKTFDGVSGPIQWDPTGANTRSPTLGTIRQGQLSVLPTAKETADPESSGT